MRNIDLICPGSKSRLLSGVALAAMAAGVLAPTLATAQNTLTPIKHVIIIIGENRTFDNIFATYQPVSGDTVLNLLSQGIVNAEGTPGPNYSKAQQFTANLYQPTSGGTTTYQISPAKALFSPYLPPFQAGGPATPYLCTSPFTPPDPSTGTSCNTTDNIAYARTIQNGLDDNYYQYLLTVGTGQPSGQPDTRLSYDVGGGTAVDASHLPNGPFQLTSPALPYDAYTASPVHRFFQMWQQVDCSAATVTSQNGWAAATTCFPGSKLRSQPAPTARRSRRTTSAKARPRCFSSTSNGAMRPI